MINHISDLYHTFFADFLNSLKFVDNVFGQRNNQKYTLQSQNAMLVHTGVTLPQPITQVEFRHRQNLEMSLPKKKALNQYMGIRILLVMETE